MKRELAHVGMFGADGTTITRQHLVDCKETFDGKCPVTLGHRLADWMPRFGNVKTVELAKGGDSLVGDVEEHDLLAEAKAAGFYADCSVQIQRRAVDGKHYLHHLAYLGAVPPKIRDLQVFADIGVVYCGDTEGATEFTEKKPDTVPAAGGGQPATTGSPVGQPPAPGVPAQPAAGAANQSHKEEDVELKQENEQLKKQLADSNAARVATAKDGLKKAMEGRIPKGKQGLVLALADTLDPESSIELADEEGKKEKVSGLEILRRVLEVIPLQVKEGKADLGDPEKPEKPVDMTKLMSHV